MTEQEIEQLKWDCELYKIVHRTTEHYLASLFAVICIEIGNDKGGELLIKAMERARQNLSNPNSSSMLGRFIEYSEQLAKEAFQLGMLNAINSCRLDRIMLRQHFNHIISGEHVEGYFEEGIGIVSEL